MTTRKKKFHNYILSGEAANINFTVVGLTRPGLEPTICHNSGCHVTPPMKLILNEIM
jgi:hypothetical protein